MSGHEGQVSSEAGAGAAAAADPSMDDILASIRRILNEEDAPASAPEVALEPAPVSPHTPAAETEVLELEHSMMLPDEAPLPVEMPASEPAMVVATQPEPVAIAFAEAMPIPQAAAIPQAVPLPEVALPSLVAPEAAAAAAISVGALMRTLANERATATHRGGPTIEDLVRDEMRPLLKMWLDLHLAPMVERLVRAEIERVVNRMT